MKNMICPFCGKKPDYKQEYNYNFQFKKRELVNYLQCDCVIGGNSLTVTGAELLYDKTVDDIIDYMKRLDARIARNEKRIAKAKNEN